jgi:serine/threonine protein kinase
VKPGNILLENSVERVKLTDFGLARAADDTGLTRTGELAGTPEFMAPEQASNETVDHRSDLFSFGSVMYAMCTGDSPFQGTSIVAVIRQVCDKQLPPVHEVNQTIPRWLSDIIARLMAKAPDARFQSAQQLCELLERYLARVQHGDLSEMPLAQTSKSAVSRVSKLADETLSQAAPIWKSAIQQVWKPALLLAVVAALFFTLKNRRAVTPNSSPSPPTQQNRETKPSPSASIQEPFVVKTEAGKSVGSFTRIEDALAAAPPGAVIELCWNGTRDIDPISLPPKPLTLRAGRGFQPVWNNSSGAASALSANAALTLEEIRFLMTRARSFPNLGPYRPRTPPSGLALLAITNGPLRISRCTAEIRGGATHQAGIFLANVRACHIENAILWAITGKAVVWQQHSGGSIDPPSSTELGVSNCCTHAAEAFWLDFRDSARARLEIARSTFYGPGTFYVPASLAATNLEVNARQNIFHTPSVIFDARDPASPPLPRWLHWREQENLYKRDQRYIVGIAAPNGPAGLEEWNRWWNQTGANSRVVQLTFANGVSDLKPGPRLVPPEPDGFRIIDLNVVEGPPLERDQWQRFGAETDNVGSRSVK